MYRQKIELRTEMFFFELSLHDSHWQWSMLLVFFLHLAWRVRLGLLHLGKLHLAVFQLSCSSVEYIRDRHHRFC